MKKQQQTFKDYFNSLFIGQFYSSKVYVCLKKRLLVWQDNRNGGNFL